MTHALRPAARRRGAGRLAALVRGADYEVAGGTPTARVVGGNLQLAAGRSGQRAPASPSAEDSPWSSPTASYRPDAPGGRRAARGLAPAVGRELLRADRLGGCARSSTCGRSTAPSSSSSARGWTSGRRPRSATAGALRHRRHLLRLAATPLMAAGIEAFEAYAINVPGVGDGARATVIASPNVRIALPWVEPAISAFTTIGTPLQGASHRIWGFRLALTRRLRPDRRRGHEGATLRAELTERSPPRTRERWPGSGGETSGDGVR